jgi:hypothetical protein
MLKIILSNPANNIVSIDAEAVSKKLSVFIQAIREPETQPGAKP